MKIELESTDRIVQVSRPGDLKPIPARIWQGKTDTGIPVVCCIVAVAVADDQDQTQFQEELEKKHVAAGFDAERAFPLRMLI